MYTKVTLASDLDCSLGSLKAGEPYAIPQDVYKAEIWGKVGHTNHGLCTINDAIVPSKPVLPALLDQQEPDYKPDPSKTTAPIPIMQDEEEEF